MDRTSRQKSGWAYGVAGIRIPSAGLRTMKGHIESLLQNKGNSQAQILSESAGGRTGRGERVSGRQTSQWWLTRSGCRRPKKRPYVPMRIGLPCSWAIGQNEANANSIRSEDG